MSSFLREAKKASNGRGQRPRPDRVPKTSTPRSSEIAPAKQTVGFSLMNERLTFAAQVLIGYLVEVHVKNGTVYEGIFHTIQVVNKELNVVLKWARVVKDPSNPNLETQKPSKTLIIYSAHLVQVFGKDIKMGPADVGPLAPDEAGLGTDAAIGRNIRGGLPGRELQRWDAPEQDEALEDLQLDDGGRHWDQFEVNKKLFGVETTFDEDLYTTKLDKNNMKISVAEATRLAREIETNSGSNNVHLLEERGLLDDSGVTEEELYSAVLRQDAGSDKYSRKDTSISNADEHLETTSSSGSKSAWGNPNSSVTTVPGSQLTRKPSGEACKRSVPIDVPIDHRKEANRVKMHLTTAKKERSPYGTPKGTRSPLASPLVGNAIAIEALDLNPGIPRIDAQTLQEFKAFKQKEAQNRLNKEQELRMLGDVRSQSSRSQHASSLSPDNRLTDPAESQASSEISKDYEDKTATSSKGEELGTGLSVCSSKSSLLEGSLQGLSISTCEAPEVSASELNGVTVAETAFVASANSQPKLKSSLNPFAKEFKLNPNAKEFKPGAGWGNASAGPGPGSGNVRAPNSNPEPAPTPSVSSSGPANVRPTPSPVSSSGPPNRKDFHPRGTMSSPIHMGPVPMPMPQAMAGGWMPQQFLPGQFIAPMMGGSPQQHMMYAVRPPFGPSGGGPFMVAGSPYGMAMYASQMGGTAGNRPPMFGPQFQMAMGGMPGMQMAPMAGADGISDSASAHSGKSRE